MPLKNQGEVLVRLMPEDSLPSASTIFFMTRKCNLPDSGGPVFRFRTIIRFRLIYPFPVKRNLNEEGIYQVYYPLYKNRCFSIVTGFNNRNYFPIYQSLSILACSLFQYSVPAIWVFTFISALLLIRKKTMVSQPDDRCSCLGSLNAEAFYYSIFSSE